MWKYLRYGLLSLVGASALVSMAAGQGWMWFGFALAIALALGGDSIFGDDLSEPTYRHTWLLDLQLYSNLPMLLLMTFVFAWHLSDFDPLGFGAFVTEWTGYDLFAARAQTEWSDYLGGGLALGLFYGVAGTNVGHELTHRTWSVSAQVTGRWMLALTSDASFAIEHVYGHHKHVATRQDSATARRGESAWVFVIRSTVGSYLSAWRIERERLERQGRSVWSWRNKMHRGNLMTACYLALFAWIGGWVGALVFLAISLYGKGWLELVNYMEHYGLVRVPGEPVEPRHSWNCNRRISGYLLYNLTRHSHHHAMGEKPFWELRAYPDTPMMPHGYLTMVLVALIPPLWDRLVIPRVIAWDARFATDSERELIEQANAASGHAWFQHGLPPGVALPEICGAALPEPAANTDLARPEERLAAAQRGALEGRILKLVGRASQRAVIQGTEVDFEVQGAETILSAALRQGLDFPHNCRVGGCAACKCKLIKGSVRELTDSSYILSAEQLSQRYILACQSVPRTPVTLELDDPSSLLGARRAHPIYRTAARITSLVPLTHDILELTIALQGPISFTPGQYADLSVPGVIQGARSYSMAHAPQEDQALVSALRFHVRRVPGGAFTGWLHDTAQPGDELALEGPFGDFALRSAPRRPIVAVAGGSGMAPLLALLEGASQEDRGREVVYFYGARQRRDLYAQSRLDALAKSWEAPFEFIPVLSGGAPQDGFEGKRGLVTEALKERLDERPELARAQLYMCGPPGMIDAAIEVAGEAGLDPDSIYFDRFLDRSHVAQEEVARSA